MSDQDLGRAIRRIGERTQQHKALRTALTPFGALAIRRAEAAARAFGQALAKGRVKG